MFTVAHDLKRVAGVLTILATVFAVGRGRATASRVRARYLLFVFSLFVVGHVLIPPLTKQDSGVLFYQPYASSRDCIPQKDFPANWNLRPQL
jgi:hypothetical protein